MGRINIRRQLPDIIHFSTDLGKGRRQIRTQNHAALRSGFGMALVIACMGFATHPWHLLVLRSLNGTISGFNPAAISLVSGTTPKNRMGFAMGIMQSGQVAGTILGPLIGGLMASWVGFRPIFYITGGLIFAASMLALFLVKENFNREQAAKAPQPSVIAGLKELSHIPHRRRYSPSRSCRIRHDQSHGAAAAVRSETSWDRGGYCDMGRVRCGGNGLSNMIASPILGKLSDKVGAHRILTYALIGTGLTLIPQAFVQSVWQLIIVRFMMGVFMGGLSPSVNALIRSYTPDGMESRSFGFNTSSLALGNMLGRLSADSYPASSASKDCLLLPAVC